MITHDESIERPAYDQAPVPSPNAQQIAATYNLTKSQGEGCVELRVIGNKAAQKYEDRLTRVGFYDNIDAFVRDALRHHGKQAVYFGLNLRAADLLHAQPANRLQFGEGGKTEDVPFRGLFGIDIDTRRRSSRLGATADEVQRALPVFLAIKSELEAKGVPFIPADSGNGKHLNIPIIPHPTSTDSESKNGAFALLLRSLQRRFGTEAADVDVGVFDAPRVWKLYGTTAVKGGNTQERPWRLAFADFPPIMPGPVDLLTKFEAEIQEQRAFEALNPKPRFGGRTKSLDLVELFRNA